MSEGVPNFTAHAVIGSLLVLDAAVLASLQLGLGIQNPSVSASSDLSDWASGTSLGIELRSSARA